MKAWAFAMLLLAALQCFTAAADDKERQCSIFPAGAFVSAPNATIWGQQIMVAFGSGFRHSMGATPGFEGPWLAPLITGVVLTLISCVSLVQAWHNNYWTMHSILVALYALFTGVVEFARFNFDASRFGFLTASWHNIWEYQLIAYLVLSKRDAEQWLPTILCLVWMLDVFIMFVPSLDGVMSGIFWGGFPEQLTGICADFVLLVLFLYLWLASHPHLPGWARRMICTVEHPNLHTTFGWGLLASLFHMLEIIPLVMLLSGLTPRPAFWICIAVAVTSPITFYIYTQKFNVNWNRTHIELTNARPTIHLRNAGLYCILACVIGMATILGPPIKYPVCPHGQPTATGKPEASALAFLSPTPKEWYASKEETADAVAARWSATLPCAAAQCNKGSDQLSCVSSLVLVGYTNVTAKPKQQDSVVKLVSTMTAPIRREEGSLYYQIASTDTGVLLTEKWSSIRTLMAHLYLSPTVSNVFRSPAFRNAIAGKPRLIGPHPALQPCSLVHEEPEPVDLTFSVTLDMYAECAWASISQWTSEFSWVPGAKGITTIIPGKVRTLHLGTGSNVTEALPPDFMQKVSPPTGGHGLTYHTLAGGLVAGSVEVLTNDLTLQTVAGDPGDKPHTLLIQKVTAVPRPGASADTVIGRLRQSYGPAWQAHMQQWAKSIACEAAAGDEAVLSFYAGAGQGTEGDVGLLGATCTGSEGCSAAV